MPRPERRLDEDDGPLVRFAAELRKLRDRAGRPSYRELGATAHYSSTTLSDAAAGRKLPTLPVTLAYVGACGGDVAEWERKWHTLAAELASQTTGADGHAGGPAPYVGLASFELADADRFFGRDTLVSELVGRVTADRFVAVFGASGVGKSSVLRAGLLATWVSAETTRHVLFTPGAHPLRECALAMADVLGMPADRVAVALAEDPGPLYRDAGELLVVVDQFEEIFTQCAETEERVLFVSALLRAVRAPESRLRVVLGVRTDFYTHCAHDPDLAELLRDGQFLVGPMTTQQMHSAIAQPAVRCGITVEAALLATVVADCAGRPGVLPLLSHALLETWRRRRGTMLTLSGYQAAGGIAHAIAQTAELTYAEFGPRQQQLVRTLFLRLTAPGELTEDTKRRIDRDELNTDDPETTAVLERLAAARLLTLDHEHIEITHEAVIRHWPRLRDWLAGDREALRTHRQLTEAATGWHELGRHSDVLYQGIRLANARSSIEASGVVLTRREADFLAASTAAEEHRHLASRRRTRRLRQLVGLLAVCLVVAGALAGVALSEEHAANAQRALVDAQSALAEATQLENTDPALAHALILAAARLASTQATRSAVLDIPDSAYPQSVPAMVSPVATGTVTPDGRMMAIVAADRSTVTVRSVSGSGDIAVIGGFTSDGQIRSIALSPDGQLLAVTFDAAAGSPMTQLWRLDHDHLSTVGLLPNPSAFAAFSGDGRLLFTGDHSWDVTDPATPRPVTALPGVADGIPNHDGSLLAGTFNYGEGNVGTGLRLWVRRPGGGYTQASQIKVPNGDVSTEVFDPASAVLAVGTGSGTTELFDVTNPAAPVELATFPAQSGIVTSLAFSEDGHALAAGTNDGSISVWHEVRTNTWSADTTLVGTDTDSQGVVSLGFSATAQYLIVAGTDQGAEEVVLPELTLRDTTLAAAAAAIRSDGRWMATSDQAGVQLWDISQPLQPVPAVRIAANDPRAAGRLGGPVALSPNGRLMATSGPRGGELWDVTNPRLPRPLRALVGPWSANAFSPDGRMLVTDTESGEQLSDVASGGRASSFNLPGEIGPTVFSDDNRLMATISNHGIVTEYRIDSSTGRPQPLLMPGNLPDPAMSLAFQPHTDVLAIGRSDGTVQLRGQDGISVTLGSVGAGQSNADQADRIAFSPDGTMLAVASAEHTTRLWDVRAPSAAQLIAVLSDASGPIGFTPDGRALAVVDGDGTIQLRAVDEQDVIDGICGAGEPAITRAQWNQYLPGVPYQPPCAG